MPFFNKKRRVILSIIILFFVLFLFAQVVQAQDETPKPIYFTPQVGIGDKVKVGEEIEVGSRTFANYVIAIYNWSIRAIVLLAIVMIMIAGSRWMFAGGNAALITQAKNQIISALIGLVIAIGSYTLLNFINPSLVRLGSLEIDPIQGELLENLSCTVKIEDDGICIEAGDLYSEYAKRDDCKTGQCPATKTAICCKTKAVFPEECMSLGEVECPLVLFTCWWDEASNQCLSWKTSGTCGEGGQFAWLSRCCSHSDESGLKSSFGPCSECGSGWFEIDSRPCDQMQAP